MRYRLLARLALASLLALLLVSQPEPTGAQTPSGTIAGALPASGGVGLGVWNGGTLIQLTTAATARGCILDAAWATPGGRFVGYVFGAPPVVNAEFLGAFPGSIAGGTALILVCRAPKPPAPASAAVPGIPGDAIDRELERLIFIGLNAERTNRGLPALVSSPILNITAIKYAELHWYAGLPLDHELGGTQLWDRARAEGYPSFNTGEILAAQQRTENFTSAEYAPRFVTQWMDSPPHRAIVLGEALNATEMGIGCAHGRDRTAQNLTICVGMTGRP